MHKSKLSIHTCTNGGHDNFQIPRAVTIPGCWKTSIRQSPGSDCTFQTTSPRQPVNICPRPTPDSQNGVRSVERFHHHQHHHSSTPRHRNPMSIGTTRRGSCPSVTSPTLNIVPYSRHSSATSSCAGYINPTMANLYQRPVAGTK